MKTKHTPGPWHNRYFDRVDGNSYTIAWLHNHDQAECAANARLIAAAPDMIEALDAIYDGQCDEISEKTMKLVRAAIRKAKGDV